MKKRKLNWALLSTARINERLIPEIRKSKNSQLMAVASRDIKKSENYAKKHNIQKAYGSYEDLLEDKDIDVVYISLPNHLHAERYLKEAKAKKQADSTRSDSRRHGIKFSDAKGSGRIKAGKKIYD